MELYVVRHAIAEERDGVRWPDDSERPLTDRGRERFRFVAETLGRIVPEVDVLLSSRFVRAWQTAELLSEQANWVQPTACSALEFGSSEEVCDSLGQYHGANAIAVVGHEPCLSELVGYFLTGNDGVLDMEFKKGGAVRLWLDHLPRAGAGVLCWYLTPKLARAIIG